MSGPGFPLLDVAVGMSFVYLGLSLVVTATTELLAALLDSRARTLRLGIHRLLQHPEYASGLFAHPLIQSLSRKPWKAPSYIPSRTFALALLDMVDPADPGRPRELASVQAAIAKLPEGPLKRNLGILLAESGQRLREFERAVETWFNNAMERVSGWYKRRTQWTTLGLALGVTLAANADTVRIVQTLWREPAIRTALISQAEAFARSGAEAGRAGLTAPAAPGSVAEAPPCPPYELCGIDVAATNFQESIRRLATVPVPLGWGPVSSRRPSLSELLWHLGGLVMTAIAISLGAPFWFDILNRFISIRAAGKAPEETQKSPRVVPPAAAAGTAAPQKRG